MTEAAKGETDEALAKRAAQGSRSSFDMLVGRYKEPLYRFVRRYAGQSDDAYDILQESFVSAWLALKRYDPQRPFSPWLHRIALNKCRDYGRRQTVRRIVLRSFALEMPTMELPGSSAENAADAERLSRLDRAISGLPAHYKEPLLLTAIQGLSHDDAAAILKISVKAVEMRVYRARRQLRQELLDMEKPSD